MYVRSRHLALSALCPCGAANSPGPAAHVTTEDTSRHTRLVSTQLTHANPGAGTMVQLLPKCQKKGVGRQRAFPRQENSLISKIDNCGKPLTRTKNPKPTAAHARLNPGGVTVSGTVKPQRHLLLKLYYYLKNCTCPSNLDSCELLQRVLYCHHFHLLPP